MIDPLSTWISTFALLKPSSDLSWSDNIATFTASRVVAPQLLTLTGQFLFSFAEPIFASALKALPPTPDKISAASAFANAWQSAILASPLVTLPGAFLLSPTPPTLFSVVASTIVDPDSLVLATQGLTQDLVSTPPSLDSSSYPKALYKAFTTLTYTVIGTNSVPPPAGPLPFTAPKLAFG